MQNYDFFDCVRAADGGFIIRKNGEPFLNCNGSEDDAKQIVRLLQEDSRADSPIADRRIKKERANRNE